MELTHEKLKEVSLQLTIMNEMRILILLLVTIECQSGPISQRNHILYEDEVREETFLDDHQLSPMELWGDQLAYHVTGSDQHQVQSKRKAPCKRQVPSNGATKAAVVPRGCGGGGCGSCGGCGGCSGIDCAKSPCCDPTGANSPSCQQKTTQLAQEAACAAKAAADAQAAAGAQASCQVRAQLAEKACQASNSAQAALEGKKAMLDVILQQLSDAQALAANEAQELSESDSTENMIKQAVCASQQLARNMGITAQQSEKLSCILSQIDQAALQTEDEETGLKAGTQRKVEQLTCMVDNACKDLQCTCEAAKQAAEAARQSQQFAMRSKRAKPKRSRLSPRDQL